MKAGIVLGTAIIALIISGIQPGSAPAGGAGGFFLPPGASLRWGLSAINAPEAWQVTLGSEDIVVAVIDSGIDRSIPALADRMWRNPDEIPHNGIDDDGNGYVDDVYGWAFRDGDPDSLSGTPIHGHGTFVAGLIAAAFDAATGAGGVAPRVRLMDLRFLDSRALFYSSDWRQLAAAIDYAVEEGARVINLSVYAKLTPPAYVRDALRRAVAHGVLVVGIAGNDGTDRIGYFGAWPEVLAVAAVDRYGRPARFSNRGPEVDLAGPGVQVVSFAPGGELITGSGTSFAAPHVAGTAALLLSLHPDLGLEELVELLTGSAVDLDAPGPDPATGAGLVDAGAAISQAVSRP